MPVDVTEHPRRGREIHQQILGISLLKNGRGSADRGGLCGIVLLCSMFGRHEQAGTFVVLL